MLERLSRAGRRLLGLEPVEQREAPPERRAAPGEPVEPVHPRVLMIVHNPPVQAEAGRRLAVILGWNDPGTLVRQYIEDVREASGGYVHYEVADRIDADWFPVKLDGFRYTGESYLRAWRTRSFHQPDAIDYEAQVAAFDLIGRYDRHELDEVWFVTFPYSGDYESTMVGRGAFWLNSPPVPHTERASGRFAMMGFSYERGVGEMLEDLCHRVEATMSRVYERLGRGRDMWQLYTRYDQVAPGRAQCGNTHFAPNSTRDYDWGNRRVVTSYCDDWYSYPELPGRPRRVECEEWGCGDARAHHRWWLRHLPRAAGETDGVANNWWSYVVDPNRVP